MDVMPQSLALTPKRSALQRLHAWYRRHVWTATAGLILAVLVAGFVALQVVMYERIGDGVAIAGVDVSGLSVRQAQGRVERTLLPGLQRVTFTTPKRTLHADLGRLGFRVDAAAAATAAYEAGRRTVGGLIIWLPGNGEDIPLAVDLDKARFQKRLEGLRAVVEVPPTDARLRLDGGEVAVVPSEDGSAVDAAALAAAIRAAVATGRPFAGPVPMQAVSPQVSTAEAQGRAQAASVYVAAPLTLRMRDATVVLEPDQLAPLLSVTTGEDADDYPLTFDNAEARRTLRGLLADAEVAPVDATLTPLENGGVRIGQSQDGVAVDMDRLVADMDEAAVGGGLRSVHVALVTVPPALSTADVEATGLAGVGSQFVTYFDPRNTARATNIALAAKLVDGAVVRPGAVFSLNAAMGPRTANRGFDYAPVIAADNVLRQGVGGGICQYATTLFNAAFFAGLPIVERHNHSLFISHYPIGRDATVSWGSADFKFRNDTGKPLTIRSWTDGGALSVAILGRTGRKVTTQTGEFYDVRKPRHGKSDPRIVYDGDLASGITRWEKGVNGLSVRVTRVVRRPGGDVLYRDTFTSTYAPMDWIKRVGTG